jgi:serine/threonine protein kinase
LLTGRTPFLGSNDGVSKNAQDLYDNILNVRIEFPEDFPTLAKDFVLGMIKRNPKERMGFPEIKSHPWLQEKMESTIKFSKQVAIPNGVKPE